MQRSNKDKGKDENAKPAAQVELKQRAKRARERKHDAQERLEHSPTPPTTIAVVNGRLEK